MPTTRTLHRKTTTKRQWNVFYSFPASTIAAASLNAFKTFSLFGSFYRKSGSRSYHRCECQWRKLESGRRFSGTRLDGCVFAWKKSMYSSISSLLSKRKVNEHTCTHMTSRFTKERAWGGIGEDGPSPKRLPLFASLHIRAIPNDFNAGVGGLPCKPAHRWFRELKRQTGLSLCAIHNSILPKEATA